MDTGGNNGTHGVDGSYGYIDDLTHADPSLYHPYDVLILKHFPDTDLASRHHYRTSLDLALSFEKQGKVPPHASWALPPPRPREELEEGVEDWRSTILHAIDARLALYAHNLTLPSSTRPAITSDAPLRPTIDRAHRALHVNEILENILRHATPSSQYAAWNVSVAWRDMIAFILKSQYRSHIPCSPVDYDQLVNIKIQWLQPSALEIAHTTEVVDKVLRSAGQHTYFYFPARLTQAHQLPELTSNAIGTLVQRKLQYFGLTYPRREEGRRWLDLSQIQFSPYFLDLFRDCIQLKLGRCEITVYRELEERLASQSSPLADPELGELIESMFLTQPPIKALGIYSPSNTVTGRLKSVARICNTDGIRIRDLLSGLEQVLTNAINIWRNYAQAQRKTIAEPEWTKFSYPWKKSNIRWAPGFPKLVIFLESSDGSTLTIPRASYVGSEDSNELFRNEWFEPSQPGCTRSLLG